MKKKIGLYGTCRISKLIHTDLNISDNRNYENKNYEFIVQPVHYTTSSTESLQALYLTENPNPLKLLSNEQKDDFYFYSKNREPCNKLPLQLDGYVFEICSFKYLDFITENIRFPYKSQKYNYNIYQEDTDIIKSNFEKIINHCGGKPILIIPPLIFNELPEKMKNHRIKLTTILNSLSTKYNFKIYDISKDINNLGYENTMSDFFHFKDKLVEKITISILEWSEKNVRSI